MVKTGDTRFRESGVSSGKRQKRFWMNTVFHGTGRVLAAFGLLLFSLLCNVGVAWAQTVSIADSEGNPDTGVVFTVTLSGTVGAAKARVDYRTVLKRPGATAIPGNQGCTPGVDYPHTSGSLSFPAGSGGGTTQTFTVRVCGDRTFPDSGYWFDVQLENAMRVSISRGLARGTIRPVGASQAGLTFDPESLAVDEGGMGSYTVVLNREPTGEVTVRLSVEPEGAVEISPEDLTYDATDWGTPKTVTVTGSDDGDIEDEMVVVTHVAEGAGYNGISGAVNVTVDDDDTTPVLSEREVLEVFYAETGGGSWSNSLNWSSNIPDATDLGTLHGVTVDSSGRVLELRLDSNQLSGSIPEELGQLSSLSMLWLHNNQLTGTIPTELGNLTNLRWLYLYNNELSGEIPEELGQLSSLAHLRLDNNQLTGTIPTELGSLTKLFDMLLYNNQLTGTIPTELGNLTKLLNMRLDNNQLTGTIPTELGNLTSFIAMYLSNNQLSGTIPTELGNLTNLLNMRLDNNQLTGTIPTELGNLTALLQWLYLNGNQLSGTIPTELGQLTGLTELLLDDNQLSGQIPAELGSLTTLQFLLLHNNRLSGSIPTELGNLTALLQWMYLHNNQLTGAIPTELGNLTVLNRMILSGNQLSGQIPAELGSLTTLQFLLLHRNQLSGSIPTELGNLTALWWMYLHNNQLNGEIPTELGQLTSLQRMYLSNNQLTGMIPLTELEALATTHNLQDLALWGNGGLTGTISDELGKRVDRAALRFLYEINGGSDWTNNQNWLSNQPFLDWHGVDVNSDGRVSVLNLADNNLSGEITNALEALEGLETLNLADNRELEGTLPLGLMNLSGLTTLNIEDTGMCASEDAGFQQWLGTITFTGTNCSSSPQPGPTPDPDQPGPTPDPDQPGPTPDPDQPGPTPDPDQPGPTPDPDQPGPTPVPDQPGPTPDPDQPGPTPVPDQPGPTPVPDSGDMGGGGGCAIAFDGAEAGRNATESTMFNLLLVVSAILAISLRNRAREKRV